MKFFLTLALFAFPLMASPCLAETLENYQKQMQTYRAQDFVITAKRSGKDVFNKISEVYDILEKAAAAAQESKERP